MNNQYFLEKLDTFNLVSQHELLIDLKKRLEDADKKYNNLYESLPVPFFSFNIYGIILESNQLAANLLSINKEATVQQSFARYICPESQAIFLDHCKTITTQNHPGTCEIKILQRCGSFFHIQLKSKQVFNSSLKEIQILSFVSKIYGRQNNSVYQEDTLAPYNENYKGVDDLIQIICHELNHPIGVINNYLNGCILRLDKNNFKIDQLLDVMRKTILQLQRINEIILKMRNFTYNVKKLEYLCLNKLITNAVFLLKNELNDFDLKVSLRLTEQLPLVTIDKIYIEQVMLNIFRNAMEAMRDARTIDPQLIVETNFVDSNKVEVVILDNGPGLPSDLYYKLFHPYFTTKPYGIGIGLTMCKLIIEKHGGNIFIEANPFGGACIRFTLPLQKH